MKESKECKKLNEFYSNNGKIENTYFMGNHQNVVIKKSFNSNLRNLKEWCDSMGYKTREGKNIIEIRNKNKSKITIRFKNEIERMGVIELATLQLELINYFKED